MLHTHIASVCMCGCHREGATSSHSRPKTVSCNSSSSNSSRLERPVYIHMFLGPVCVCVPGAGGPRVCQLECNWSIKPCTPL